ncbi:MAG: peptide chain release factor N(5)-glutamine methyltransferase [Mycoplasma sp.]|nr:peptide chain release factor N(5)-glutamine methyltransferase [Mycoplasma sp.]
MKKEILNKRIQELLTEKRRYELEEKISFNEKIKLRRNAPIQKIIGYIEMANVKIDISKKVLIPRYETEELIELAKKHINKNKYKSVLDLCCGSGFIGIAIKKCFPNIDVVQSDIDKKSIKQSKINLNINNVLTCLIKSDMFENIVNKFDVIISNPPYLHFDDKKNMNNSVLKYEPHHALFAKNNGLYFYEVIEENIHKFLNKNGLIILEINPINSYWFINKEYKIVKDINGKDRFAYKYI